MRHTQFRIQELTRERHDFSSTLFDRSFAMTPLHSPKSFALGLLGAAVGGCVGYFAFGWILKQGFHSIMVPPAMLGFGAGYLSKVRSQPLAIVCAVAGLALGLFSEWQYFPFIKDESLLYFLTHVHQLQPIVLGLLALGTVICYRLALGIDQKPDAF